MMLLFLLNQTVHHKLNEHVMLSEILRLQNIQYEALLVYTGSIWLGVEEALKQWFPKCVPWV